MSTKIYVKNARIDQVLLVMSAKQSTAVNLFVIVTALSVYLFICSKSKMELAFVASKTINCNTLILMIQRR